MKHTFWGEMTFHVGWKVDSNILFYGKEYGITLKARAYRKEDGITAAQDKALSDFAIQKDAVLKIAEVMLDKFRNGNGAAYFIPRTLLFERDGSYALLCDDSMDVDNGVAVCLAPKQEVLSQDEYL